MPPAKRRCSSRWRRSRRVAPTSRGAGRTDRPDPVADELYEVELFGFVTTMTAAEVRAFAARLLAMIGDAPQQALVAGAIRQFYPEKGTRVRPARRRLRT